MPTGQNRIWLVRGSGSARAFVGVMLGMRMRLLGGSTMRPMLSVEIHYHAAGVWLRLPLAPAARIGGPRRPEPLALPRGPLARVSRPAVRPVKWAAAFGLVLKLGRARAVWGNSRLALRRPQGRPEPGALERLPPYWSLS